MVSLLFYRVVDGVCNTRIIKSITLKETSLSHLNYCFISRIVGVLVVPRLSDNSSAFRKRHVGCVQRTNHCIKCSGT